ncbi:LysM domain-containing protein [Pseudoduganella flava]|uniref:LysM domain-containing protein n=1 Tax=Pseudoduganella flava TaxID=871742 RepID=A0A562Q310_9BURK|nr:LysM peptidoglycan-binding domain-containing protein [Pseudoduganella flava]QGZ41147.1 LysM peptidoglycan-binding domain-containing protein [Pseudoduganella flava]TWI51077.1 LysM domain-containing protein [Pseudoduganella flava]
MKNFSTVGVRAAGHPAAHLAVQLIAAALFSAGAAVSVHAQDLHCAFKANAPDQHTVVRGDTLWDISGKFLEQPWCWPQVWGMNRAEIANPHWIYPGQVILFDRAAGRLRLANKIAVAGADSEPGTVKLSPQLRTEALGKDAIPAIPPGAIEPFLTQPLIVEADELKDAPRIVATAGNRVIIGKDDKAYVRGNLKGGTSFQAFRPGKPLRDPVTQKVVGQEAYYLGTLKLQKEAGAGSDVHTFVVASAKEEMGIGDQLMQMPPTPMQNYVPHPPAGKVDARILAIYNGVTHAGQNQVVSVNRGKLDGLDVGAVLQLYHVGQTVADKSASKGWHNLGNPQVKLPDEQIGSLFIFRVFKHISYGLIMQVTEPVVVGDVAKTPE